MLRSLLLAALLVAGLAPPALAQQAGVTAAVNQSAKGQAPGGNARTIVLGDNVVINERIDTNANGLVQILLADGTTFTVGPNSSLTIDRFVYDPAANTAEVAASVTRGVFRFIGGRTSKADGGAVVNTPVGTVGIRGAVVNFSVGGPSGTHFDLVFGKEVTLSRAGRTFERLFRAGYSIGFGADGAPGIIRTPPDWTNQIQAALTAKPGTSGGAPQKPTNQQVAQSGVAQANSEALLNALAAGMVDTSAIEQLQQLTPANLHDIANEILAELPPPTLTGTFKGFAVGIVVAEVPPLAAMAQLLLNADPDDVEVEFDAAARTFGGRFRLAATAGPSLDIDMAFGSADPAGDSLYFSDGIYAAAGDGSAITATIDGVGVVQAPPGPATVVVGIANEQNYSICDCPFLQWGMWEAAVPGELASAIGLGLWVTGDVTGSDAFETYADGLPTGTVATYNGTAIGVVNNGALDAAVAVGDMALNYDFGARAGDMSITNFDGRDFTGLDFAGGPVFAGFGTDYQVNGAFVNDGSTIAAGVIGNFELQQGSWQAAGVFGGAR
jgi:hypothetical protein